MSRRMIFQEMDALGERYAAKYLDYCRYSGGRPGFFDITDFIMSYLQLEIVSVEFADPGRGAVGFLADGRTPLAVIRDGVRTEHCYRKGTVVVDRSLLRKTEQDRLRFTLAHEAAHYLLQKRGDLPLADFYPAAEQSRGGNDSGKSVGANRANVNSAAPDSAAPNRAEKEPRCTPAGLARILSLREACADRLAAALLMPRFIVEDALLRFNRNRLIHVSADGTLAGHERNIIRLTAHHLMVSESALFRRLLELQLMDDMDGAHLFVRRWREENGRRRDSIDAPRREGGNMTRRDNANIPRRDSANMTKRDNVNAPRVSGENTKRRDNIDAPRHEGGNVQRAGRKERHAPRTASQKRSAASPPRKDHTPQAASRSAQNARKNAPAGDGVNAPGLNWYEYYPHGDRRVYAQLPLEVRIKLEMARARARAMEKRIVECPYCGHKILVVYGLNEGIGEVKCPKCKYEGPLDLANFRTWKGGQTQSAVI